MQIGRLAFLLFAASLVGRPQAGDVAIIVVEAIALDRGGHTVVTLRPEDFKVDVEGRPGKVVSVRYVAARPRTVFFAIDETSIARGAEKPVADLVARLIAGLAPEDRLGLAAMPVPRGPLTVGAGREPIRAAMERVSGRATGPETLARADTDYHPDQANRQWDDEPGGERQQTIGDRLPGLAGQANAPLGSEAAAAEPGRASSLQALARLATAMNGVSGPKAIVLVWGGVADARDADQRAQRAEIDAVVSAAAASKIAVHLVTVPRAANRRVRSADLERMAAATGGVSISSSDGDLGIQRIAAALSGGYLLEIEAPGMAADRTISRLAIRTTARDVTLFAPSRWLALAASPPAPRTGPVAADPMVGDTPKAEAVPPPVPVDRTAAPAPLAAPGDATPPPGTVVKPRPLLRKPDAELEALLVKVCGYLDGFVRDFSNVVAEEEYRQHLALNNMSAGAGNHMVVRSDVLLVRTGGRDGWVPFRDVFEVNGNPVRDREERLRKLFLENPGGAMAEGLRITEESARYNLGSLYRTINLPTLPLVFLMPANIEGFRFERRADELVNGSMATRIDFREVRRPTMIRRTRTGGDVPSEGSLWVEAASGRIVQTRLTTSVDSFRTTSTVVYRPNAALGMWTPAEMQESYWQSRERFNGVATYTNFRRFQVRTEEKVAVPK